MAALGALIVALLVAVAIVGSWAPRLGLDLRGGTSLTLQARPITGGAGVTNESMQQATAIIAARVNSSGVAESSVVRQGTNQIVVQSPGATQQELRRLVGTTAELNFRQVLGIAAVAAPAPAPQLTLTAPPSVPSSGTATPAPSPPAPSAPATTAPLGPVPSVTRSPAAYHPTGSSGAVIRPAAFRAATTPSPAGGPSPAGSPSPAVTPSAAVSAPASAGRAASPAPAPAATVSIPSSASAEQVVAATVSPAVPQELLARFATYSCSPESGTNAVPANQFLITCDTANQVKYLLGPAFIKGTDVDTANARLPQQGGGWEINVNLKGGKPTDILRLATTKLVSLPQDSTTQPGQPTSNFGIVLDGRVESAPYIQGVIPGGSAQISGSFTQKSAQQLAQTLKFGALPLAFEVQTAQTTSATLGGEQLRWGLIAGGIGLALTVLFALVYYRALAMLVAGSLAVAGALSYLLVVYLGGQIGYALSLPGIAGFIVAIGITADSFVVYFERLRDEIRDGRPLRTAVETGWVRARKTILSADFVSLLAAVVLFVLAIQDVRGFAFTLGLTTIVDVIVVFLFTKPCMTLLARTRFYGQGHRFSGLDPEHIGRRLNRPGLGRRDPASAAGEPVTPDDAPQLPDDPAEAARARARARAGATRAGATAATSTGTSAGAGTTTRGR